MHNNKLKKTILVISISLIIINSVHAAENDASLYNFQHSDSVISDRVFYDIGGGSAILPSSSHQTPNAYDLGLGWQGDFMCGNFSLKSTIKNQLNGITEGFKDLMSKVIQSAQKSVASLPALVLQRANPQLYDILQNGLLQGRIDFSNAKTSCEDLNREMSKYLDSYATQNVSKTEVYKSASAQDTDAVAIKKRVDQSDGKPGTQWIGGQKKGGDNQEPIAIVQDVVKAGYNLLNKKDASSTATIGKQDCNGMLCSVWNNPQAAAAWGNKVLGDKKIQANGNIISTPGIGLTPEIETTTAEVAQKLEQVLNKPNPTQEELADVSSNSIAVTRGLINAIKIDPDGSFLAKRLANEIALTRVLEKAILIRRSLLSGLKEPNVQNRKDLTEQIKDKIKELDDEIAQVKMEMDLQKSITNNTATVILNKAEQEKQKGAGSYIQDDANSNFRNMQQGNTPKQEEDNGLLQIPKHNITVPQDKSNPYSVQYDPNNPNPGGAQGPIIGGNGQTVITKPDGTKEKRQGGTLSWRNNNPGNLRYGSFAKKMGAIGQDSKGFAVFPDMSQGENARARLVFNGDNYRNLNIKQMVSRYAPSSDNNNEAAYVKAIQREAGVDLNKTMSSFNQDERQRILSAMKKHEGFREGKVSQGK